jgi:hypothetical protein
MVPVSDTFTISVHGAAWIAKQALPPIFEWDKSAVFQVLASTFVVNVTYITIISSFRSFDTS